MRAQAFLLIGLVLGGCVGYGFSLVYTPQNARTHAELEDLRREVEDLRGEYDLLNMDHHNLMEEYIALSDAFATLTDEHSSLLEAFNETLESYDSLLMQYKIVTGSAPLKSQPLSNDTIRKDLAWVYNGKTWALSLYIPEHLYLYYSNKTRVPTEDYSVYVTHPYDDEYLSSIISKFDEIVLEEGYDKHQRANLVVAFVQSLPYTSDNVSTTFDEYPRYPIETLIQGGGDCEDTSILTSALLNAMGYDIVLINLPMHVAVGVALDAYGTYWLHEEKKYFYVETTGEGWEIGELPEEYEGEGAHIYPMLPVPVCIHQWKGSTMDHKLTLITDIQNVGTGEARGIKIFAAYEGKEGEIWNPVESDLFNLGIEEGTTLILELNEPRNVYARIVVRVLDPWGNIMDESHSEWYITD